tara:strand:- start:152 stop:994 length:843 start_codon:yes stop_codon:yes gene_type:complete
MPVDPSVWADFVSGTTVTAESFRSRFIELQKFINGRILKTDLVEEGWVSSDILFKPEFYGAPAPRVEGLSSDTHYRYRTHNKLDRYFRHEQLGCSVDKEPGVYPGDSDAAYSASKFDPAVWQPVEGMAATVYVDGASNMNAMCMGTLYALESGGEVADLNVPGRDDASPTGWTAEKRTKQGYKNQKYLSQVFVEFMLFVDTMDGSGPQARRQTQRRIYPRSGASYNFRKQQVSFVDTLELTPGVNKVSYRAWYRLKSGGQASHKHCYVDGRNFIVDLMRL